MKLLEVSHIAGGDRLASVTKSNTHHPSLGADPREMQRAVGRGLHTDAVKTGDNLKLANGPCDRALGSEGGLLHPHTAIAHVTRDAWPFVLPTAARWHLPIFQAGTSLAAWGRSRLAPQCNSFDTFLHLSC